MKTRSCSRGGSPHPSLSSKSAEKQQGSKMRHLSQSMGRPSSGLSTEVSKSHGRASSRHSSHGRPSSQMSSRLSVSRFLHCAHGAKSYSDCGGLKQNSSALFCVAAYQIVPRVAVSLFTNFSFCLFCLFVFPSFSLLSFYLGITLMCVAISQIVPRVAVSLISIEGDEKFATKHKVSKQSSKIMIFLKIKTSTRSQNKVQKS